MTGHPGILLVEDNPGDVNLIRKALDEAPVESSLSVARDESEAQRLLGSDSLDPDLVILDLNIPGRSGVAVLNSVHEIRNPPPVVVLTSSRRREDMERCDDGGASAYVVKPDTYGELVEKIERIARFYLDMGD